MSDHGDLTLTLARAWDETAATIGDRTHARWLLEVATGVEGDEWSVSQNDLLTEGMVARLDSMIDRYRSGEPLQYVLGRWGFRYLDLMVDDRVLIPRPETELVVEIAADKARACSPRRVLDLGTGSGAIGLALATELPIDDTELWLTDVSEDALAVARANLSGIGRAAANVRLSAGHWYGALANAGWSYPFDVIVSNPPYVVEGEADLSVAEWEPRVALYAADGGLAAYTEIVAGAPHHLRSGGWLVLEIGAALGDAVSELLEVHGMVDVEVGQDLAGHDRIVIGRKS